MTAGKRPDGPGAESAQEARRLLHELQVHRIEQEMQNDELRRTRDDLEAARERYFDLYENAPVGYCTLDGDGTILQANLTAARLLGVPRAALTGRGVNRAILPADRDIFHVHYLSLFEARAPQAFELRMVRAGEVPFWARLETCVVEDPGRGALCRVAISDVSDRHAATAATTRSEARFRRLFDESPACLALVGGDRMIQEVNQSMLELLAMRREDLMGLDFAQIAGWIGARPGVDADAFQRRLDGVPEDDELRFVNGAGVRKTVLLAGHKLQDTAEWPGILYVLQDITGIRQAERERDDMKRRYSEVIGRIPSGVGIYQAVDDGADFVFVDLNPAGERLSGISREGVVGRRVLEVFPGIRDIKLLDVFRRVLRTGEPETLPATLYRDERIEQWVTNQVVRLPSGEIAAVYEDVTEAVLARQRIHGFSHRLLRAREEERKKLATALHHDLGSLSVGAAARLGAVEDGIEAGDPAGALEATAECGEIIRDSVARLKAIALDLRPPDLELLGLSGALRQHITRVAGDTELQIGFTDELAGIALDEDLAIVLFRIGQEALTNVVRHAGASNVAVRLSADPAGICLSVRDDGCGFETGEVLRRPEGTMGLTATREMALAMGGVARIKAWPDRGTLVEVTLPLEKEE